MRKSLFLALVLIFTFTYSQAQVVLDGDFSDWSDKPAITSDEPDEEPVQEPYDIPAPDEEEPPPPEEENASEADMFAVEANSNAKYKISQLKWNLSEDSSVLYIMVRLSHFKSSVSGITTELSTDYGSFEIDTTYNLNDGTVFSTVLNTDITTNEGYCDLINKNTAYLEYSIPVESLLGEMKWGYMIKMRVRTEDDVQPKKDYIIICTASTGPYIGVAASALAGIGGYYYFKRKKKQ